MRKHFKDPRTDEELQASYKALAGTFRTDQGISFTMDFMRKCGREISKVFQYKVD